MKCWLKIFWDQSLWDIADVELGEIFPIHFISSVLSWWPSLRRQEDAEMIVHQLYKPGLCLGVSFYRWCLSCDHMCICLLDWEMPRCPLRVSAQPCALFLSSKLDKEGVSTPSRWYGEQIYHLQDMWKWVIEEQLLMSMAACLKIHYHYCCQH